MLNSTIILQLGESRDSQLPAAGLIFFTKGHPLECRPVMITSQPFGPAIWGRSVPKYSMPQTYECLQWLLLVLKIEQIPPGLWAGTARIKGSNDLQIAARLLNATQKYYLVVVDGNPFQVWTWVVHEWHIYRVWVLSACRVRVRPLEVKSPKKTTYSLPIPPH